MMSSLYLIYIYKAKEEKRAIKKNEKKSVTFRTFQFHKIFPFVLSSQLTTPTNYILHHASVDKRGDATGCAVML